MLVPDSIDESSAVEREAQNREIAFEVFLQAVRDLQLHADWPTASSVLLRMREVTNGGFRPKRFGFKRFRDLVYEAESRGMVTVDHQRSGDIAMMSLDHTATRPAPRVTVRRDLWKAFLDWRESTLRVYDKNEDKVYILSAAPSPLEPDLHTQLRDRLKQESNSLCRIEPISHQQQVAWMHEFAVATPDSIIRSDLLAALKGSRPAASFIGVLKLRPSERGRWYKYLQGQLRDVIEKWINEFNLSIEIDRVSQQRIAVDEIIGGTAMSAAAEEDRDIKENAQLGAQSFGGSPTSEAEIRRAVHRAIDRMPIEMVKMLPIPLAFVMG